MVLVVDAYLNDRYSVRKRVETDVKGLPTIQRVYMNASLYMCKEVNRTERNTKLETDKSWATTTLLKRCNYATTNWGKQKHYLSRTTIKGIFRGRTACNAVCSSLVGGSGGRAAYVSRSRQKQKVREQVVCCWWCNSSPSVLTQRLEKVL